MAKTSIKPVVRDTLRDRVYEELRGALMEGKFRPGEPLKLRVVAEAVGTSLMPVREALRRLVAERALSDDGRTMVVPFPTAEQFSDVLDTRLQLEPFAAGLAAERLTARELAEIEKLTARMFAATKRVDYLRFNRQFHFAIYRAADRPFLLSLVESLWLHIGPLLSHLLEAGGAFRTDDEQVARARAAHDRILDALGRGDRAAATQAMADDIASGRDEIVAQLRALPNR